jgi:hypothetical protein
MRYIPFGFMKEQGRLGTVTMTSVTSVTSTGATFNGNLIDAGGIDVSQKGFVYSSVNTTPTLSDSVSINGSIATGAYSNNVSGLTGGTIYYVRAYVTNSVGTSYSSVVSFSSTNYIFANLTYELINQNPSSTHTFNATEIWFSWSGATITGQSPTYTITNAPGVLFGSFTTPNIGLPTEFLTDSNVRFFLHRRLCSSRTGGSTGRGCRVYGGTNVTSTYSWYQNFSNSFPQCPSTAEYNNTLFLIDDLLFRPYLLIGDVVNILAEERYTNT